MSESRTEQYPEFFIRPNAPVAIAYPLRDVEGRPCGEGNAPPEKLEGVELRYKECTYAGKRRGKQMNVSALKQLVQHWEEILAVTAGLRSLYARRHGSVPSSSLGHLWMFGRTASALPAYLARRTGSPLGDGQLPADVGAAFKALQGVFMTTEDMMWRVSDAGEPRYGMQDVISAEDFLAFTEDEEVFANPAEPHKVCSGPMHMVTEFVKTVFGDMTAAPPPSPLASDADAYLTYASTNMLLGLLHAILRWRCRQQFTSLRALLQSAPEKTQALSAAEEWVEGAVKRLSWTKINEKQFPTILGLAQSVSSTDGTVRLDPRFLRTPFEAGGVEVRPRAFAAGLPADTSREVLRLLAEHDALMDAGTAEFNRLLKTLMASLGRPMGTALTRLEVEQLHQLSPGQLLA